ncbi:hypothetical protein [Leptothoe spongobia]|uniref:AB hydrolase-1 domain-containing protein n=1 Tax=Leptothoe spongobia TAU-MAC 1115 TaxID=1967444 RepID=A0A947DI58_9CYAN|nr:hypothetical protein [Leptothoe spongobia]MBT9317387.1 hypothetical protein [Leptothoe spongobia TAU-MAC 1115]
MGINGISTWEYFYHALIPPLVKARYQVIAPDFLGHGWPDRLDRSKRSLQDQARMICVLFSLLRL